MFVIGKQVAPTTELGQAARILDLTLHNPS